MASIRPELVKSENRIETVALKISRVIEKPDLRVLRVETIEMPGQPAQYVFRRRINSACAGSDERRRYIRQRLAVEIMTLEEASVIIGAQ